MRQDIITAIEREKIIAIVRGIDSSRCMRVAEALYAGGVRLLEITYDQSAPASHEATACAIGDVAGAFAGRMFVGAGTVTTPALVELTHAHGGCFIVSPDTNVQVIRRTLELGMVSLPGALTPTEILTAHRAGADFVKLFPAGELGVGYLKAVRAPINNVRLLATGGINEKNAAAFLQAGAAGLGVGGNLAKRVWIDAGEFCRLTEAAQDLVAAVRGAV